VPYLYGDSTSSPLELNYIKLLRDALGFSVDVLLARQRIRDWEESGRERELAAEGEIQRIEALGRQLVEVLEDPAGDGDGTATGRCANAIVRAASAAVDSEIAAVRAALADDLTRVRGNVTDERDKCRAALERLLLEHDLPETKGELRLRLGDGGYAATLHLQGPLGLDATLELQIPDGHLFSETVRVDKLLDHLDVSAPDKRGWLTKKVKLVSHKLNRKYVVAMSRGPEGAHLELRATAERNEHGFDVIFPPDDPGVRVLPVHKDSDDVHSPYEVSEADGEKLCDLLEKLAGPAGELAKQRVALSAVTVDGTPMLEHDDPGVLVERLIDLLTPVVREISRHSLQSDEFVLKRRLDDDRREEIFVPKAELRAKLDPLPASLRRMFDRLALGPASAEDDVITSVARSPSDSGPSAAKAVLDEPADERAKTNQVEPEQIDAEWIDAEELSEVTPAPSATTSDSVDQAIHALEDGPDDPR